MTPAFHTENGRVAPVLGLDQSQDRGGVAVLDDDGVVLFIGCAMDAQQYLDHAGLTEHWDCELVENRSYSVGLEAF